MVTNEIKWHIVENNFCLSNATGMLSSIDAKSFMRRHDQHEKSR